MPVRKAAGFIDSLINVLFLFYQFNFFLSADVKARMLIRS
jgi:hypothetical protein